MTGLDAEGKPVELEGTGLFARMLQHETGHLDGYLYVDKLLGRHARAAKKTKERLGVPGLSWMPGDVPDPSGTGTGVESPRVATWNVNSVRARADRVVDWMQRAEVDVLAMQETRV